MNGIELDLAPYESTSKRGQASNTSATTFNSKHRTLNTQLGRIDTAHDASETISPPLQQVFVQPALNPQNHSRTPSSVTDSASFSTHNSGFSSSVLTSPSLLSFKQDVALSPPTIAAGQLSPSPSPPAAPLTPFMPNAKPRMEKANAKQMVQSNTGLQSNRKRHASRARNDASHKVLETHAEDESVGDFALEHLFASFVREADKKIADCASSIAKSRISDHIEDVCEYGVDSHFDKLLAAMGYVVRKRPEMLIDKLMRWKYNHDKATTVAVSGSSPSSTSSMNPNKPSGDVPRVSVENNTIIRQESTQSTQSSFHMNRPDVAMGERRSSSATYLLCRALAEILNQTTLAELTRQRAVKLEDIIFDGTVNKIGYEDMKRSSLQQAKWSKATEVLGMLSRLDFNGVCGRYLTVLRECQPQLSSKGTTDPAVENKARVMLKGMRQLLPRGDSATPWIEFTSCVGDLVNLFANVHGQEVKTQYCRMFESLLLRVAEKIQVTYDDGKWRRHVAVLQDRLYQLSNKPKYRDIAYPALIALACVSPVDVFMARLQSLPNTLSARLREQRHRGSVLKSACRLLWAFLHRRTDVDGAFPTEIDDLVKTIFFSKKYTLSREPSITEPLIQFVRILGNFHPEYTFNGILFPLLHIELFSSSSGKDPTYQDLDPDRIILGIRAFLATITDLENSHVPAFPYDFVDDRENGDAQPQYPLTSPTYSPQLQSRKVSLVKGDRLSRPVSTQQLPAGVKESYARFCELLSRILRVCDNAFGGQASLDEKFGASSNNRMPLFVDTWSFARRDDDEHQAERTGKFGFLDLLHVAVQAIPRCLSRHTSIKGVVDLLCTGTVHTEKDIAASSAISLKSIARQEHAEVIASRFSFFIFRIDSRYSTIADGGLLGPSHIENALKLWVELLHLWEEELMQKTKNRTTGGMALDASNSMTHVDRVEAQGLLLLCSPSSYVRSCAIEVLSIVVRLDKALGQSIPRIHGILTGSVATTFPPRVHAREGEFSNIERAKLEKNSRRSNVDSAFIRLCGSSLSEDVALWYKLFPSFVQTAHQVCPTSVIQTRDDVCQRLAHIQAQLETPIEERPRAPTLGSLDGNTRCMPSRARVTSSPTLIEQYKLYLVFACATMQKQDSTLHSPTSDVSHVRKGSRSSAGGQDTFNSAQDIFGRVVPMIYDDNADLRKAAIVGLSSINPSLYHLLLQSLDTQSRSLSGEPRIHHPHARSPSSPRRIRAHPAYRQELVQIYERTSHHLIDSLLYEDAFIMQHLSEFTWSLYEYLRQDDLLHEVGGLRRFYCGLVQNFYLGAMRTPDPTRWMPFAKRKAHFIKIEEWFLEVSPSESKLQLPRSPSGRRGFPNQDRAMALENERLRTATSSAMATLCAGPFQASRPEPDEQFNVARLLAWTDKLFSLEGDKPQSTGKKALINLISNNMQYASITESTIVKLFTSTKPATIETYLDVLLDVFTQDAVPRIQCWRLVGALLFTLGHTESSIRMKSARLLRIFEENNEDGSNLRSHDIGISDRTRAVNSKAHYDISKELLAAHPDSRYACCLFSEYAERFVKISADSQRNMIYILLPWMNAIELSKDRHTGYTAATYMVLLNLIHITIQCGTRFPHEILALWQGLAVGQPGNVNCMLDFIIDLSLEKRDQNFLRTAKQIVVFLGTSDAGSGVLEYLTQCVEPKLLQGTDPSTFVRKPEGVREFPYVVSQTQIFPDPPLAMRMSMGQLSMILLVDLIVKDAPISSEKLTELLQIVLVLWDHHSQIVQEQAREMLVHLVHVFVISKADKALVSGHAPSIEELVELIRRQDPKVGWAYTDNSEPSHPYELPQSMTYVISEAIALFSLTIPNIERQWGQMALKWAFTCPAKHVACRSLQIYRHMLPPLDQSSFSMILNVTANTIGSKDTDMQAYATDLLRTIHSTVLAQEPDSPFLNRAFWAICAALESMHEWEFAEAMSTFSAILDKCSLLNQKTVAGLMNSKPHDWDCSILGSFMPSIYRGCSSSAIHLKSLDLINRTMPTGCSPNFADENCLRLGILANLPYFLHSYDDPATRAACIEPALALCSCSHIMNQHALSNVFQDFAHSRSTQENFLFNCLGAMRLGLFDKINLETTEFLMRQLLNPIPWIRKGSLCIVQDLLPRIDYSDAQIRHRGLDLFSPLLSLLQTEYCHDALHVVDQIASLTGASNDLRQLRSNYVAGNTARGPLKTSNGEPSSLFGLSTQTGWPLLDARTQGSRVSQKIRTVAEETAANTDGLSRATTLTPEIEFQKEDLVQDSYFPVAPDHDSVIEVPASAYYDTSISQLTAQLDDLDDFFEESASERAVDPEPNTVETAWSTPKPQPRPLHQSKPSVALPTTPLSHRKFDSTVSFTGEVGNGSINGSPALPSLPPSQAPMPPMSPSAFASPPNLDLRPSTRPEMPPRAATASNVETTPPERFPIPKPSVEPEPFSDDDVTSGRANNARFDAPTPNRNHAPQKSSGFSTIRNSIRRITGGSERHRRTNTHTRAQVDSSPQVPPLPNGYLPSPQDNGL